jgi:hypothetical protein
MNNEHIRTHVSDLLKIVIYILLVSFISCVVIFGMITIANFFK